MKSISPLRYPGGKAKFYDNIIKIFENNKIVSPVVRLLQEEQV